MPYECTGGTIIIVMSAAATEAGVIKESAIGGAMADMSGGMIGGAAGVFTMAGRTIPTDHTTGGAGSGEGDGGIGVMRAGGRGIGSGAMGASGRMEAGGVMTKGRDFIWRSETR